jgi:hypothetical protein
MATSWNWTQLILSALKPIQEMVLMATMGTALAPKIKTVAWQLANGAAAGLLLAAWIQAEAAFCGFFLRPAIWANHRDVEGFFGEEPLFDRLALWAKL